MKVQLKIFSNKGHFTFVTSRAIIPSFFVWGFFLDLLTLHSGVEVGFLFFEGFFKNTKQRQIFIKIGKCMI